MTTVASDSRVPVLRPEPAPYVSSESQATQSWGQPPASHYVFTVKDSVIIGVLRSGIYAQATDESSRRWPDSTVLAEIALWDEASDYDLRSFEAGLD